MRPVAHLLAALGLAAGLALAARPAHAQPFTVQPVGRIASNSNNFVSGDFDGDGDMDIAGIADLDFGLTLFLRQPAGRYEARPVIYAGRNFKDLAAGDLDGGGDIDFVTAIQGGYREPGVVNVLFRENDGRYTLRTVGTVGGAPQGTDCRSRRRRTFRHRHGQLRWSQRQPVVSSTR